MMRASPVIGRVAGGITWNPLDKGTNVLLLNQDLSFTRASGTGPTSVRATQGFTVTGSGSTSKFYEVTIDEVASNFPGLGFATAGTNLNGQLGQDLNSFNLLPDGTVYTNGEFVGGETPVVFLPFSVGDVVRLRLRTDGIVQVSKNGGSQSDIFVAPNGSIFPAVTTFSANDQGTANFTGWA